MKRLLRFWCVVLVLAGCGGGGVGVSVGDSGGGGVGSGGTGAQANGAVSIGSIDGFGSIIVNGIRFDVETATIRLADATELALGMTVAIDGVVDSDLATGTATVVTSAAELQGAVEAVDRTRRSFTLAGVAVAADDGTAYAGLADVNALATGDTVRVHGLPATGSVLRATRIERLQTGAAVIVSGSVTNLDPVNQRFRLGERVVSYQGANLDAFGGAQPQEGQLVRVRARAQGSTDVVLPAGSIERWWGLASTEGTRASVSGLVSDFQAPASFRVQGRRVDASGVTVRGGTLGNGVRADITGTVRGDVLVASRVRVRQEVERGSGSGSGANAGADPGASAGSGGSNVAPGSGSDSSGSGSGSGSGSEGSGSGSPDEEARFSASGTVSQFRGLDSFRVQGQDVDASGGGVVFTGGTAADLAAGRKVRVTGSRVSRGALMAEAVSFLR